MSKAIVARPVNGITLNDELEYLLDDDSEVRVFDSEEQARVFLVTAGVGLEELREIDGSLESMQKIVGGLIQPVYPFDDPVALVCNDEGKVMNLPLNRGLRNEDGQIYDIIAGTFFLCGTPADSDHFTSLTPEQIEQYEKRFHIPEMFCGMDGHIVYLTLEVG